MEEILKQYKYAKGDLKDLGALLEEAGDIKSRSFINSSGGSSYKGSSVERDVLSIDNLRIRIYYLRHALERINLYMDALDYTDKRLLRGTYIEGLSLHKIASELNIPYSRAMKMRKKALEYLEQLLELRPDEYNALFNKGETLIA